MAPKRRSTDHPLAAWFWCVVVLASNTSSFWCIIVPEPSLGSSFPCRSLRAIVFTPQRRLRAWFRSLASAVRSVFVRPYRSAAMDEPRDDLRIWAHEHLVYEAGMLVHAAHRVAERRLSDQDRNAFIESFTTHVRCLREFLWLDRQAKYPDDARASDFCASGVWERERPQLPEAIAEIEGKRNRVGREIVHLTYHRLHIDAEEKDWDVSGLLREIAEALARFSELAEPERLSAETREYLAAMPEPSARTRWRAHVSRGLVRRDPGL